MDWNIQPGKAYAIIPARSGSKRIKDKNIQLFRGEPLLVHSIRHALESANVDRVLVSTDSEEYAKIAKEAGAEVPFLRPGEISQDNSSDLEAFTHALEWLQTQESGIPEICVHLRPTYPLRDSKDIDAMIEILQKDDSLDAVRSIAPLKETPYKMWFLDEGNLLQPVVTTDIRDAHNQPQQSLPPAYMQNACIDVVRSSVILQKKSMTGEKIYGYVMNANYDIDTVSDLLRASHASQVTPGKGLRFCIDIDGVIATIVSGNDYAQAQPIEDSVAVIRTLKKRGHYIILSTARGTMTGKDWQETTKKQMEEWKVPYDELLFGKPAADYYIDDRSLPLESFLNSSFPDAS